jgi:hypothetical protein
LKQRRIESSCDDFALLLVRAFILSLVLPTSILERGRAGFIALLNSNRLSCDAFWFFGLDGFFPVIALSVTVHTRSQIKIFAPPSVPKSG